MEGRSKEERKEEGEGDEGSRIRLARGGGEKEEGRKVRRGSCGTFRSSSTLPLLPLFLWDLRRLNVSPSLCLRAASEGEGISYRQYDGLTFF